MRAAWPALLLAARLAAPAAAAEPVRLTSALKDLELRIYGLLENDVIADTTQGFNEPLCNSLVPKRTASGGGADNFAGLYHRTQMSVRNSRLGLELGLPGTDSGLVAKVVLEIDFAGNNAPNTVPGAQPGTQTESSFYTSAAPRLRHAYADLTRGPWNAKVGQYWSLLGWQPYYYPAELNTPPSPGVLTTRFPQARLTRALNLGRNWLLQSAAAAAKPAAMNSGTPVWQGGLRVASTKRLGAAIGNSGTRMTELSAAVTGSLASIRTNGIGNPTGGAVAVDVFVPILASADGKDRSRNLVWLGEFMTGRGIGGAECTLLSFGVPGITAAAPNAGAALDPGIAGLNRDGNAELIRLRLFRTHLQYALPGGKWAVAAGYAQIEGLNLDRFSTSQSVAYALAPKMQYGFASAFYDPLTWLRLGLEFSQLRDTYNDPANRFAQNNRIQMTTYIPF
ncbi:MAG: hypothetical protein PHF00_06625 [Elusimicrobia bacterium]|nr:hypothetical protein [Elusimicrobiota bacterium]